MIHDALLILWDCTQTIQETKPYFTDVGDEQVYNRICDIANSHHRIQNFIQATGFHSRNTRVQGVGTYGLYAQALSEGMSEVLVSYKQCLVDVQGLVLGNQSYTLSYVYSYVERYNGLFFILNEIISIIKERNLIGSQILSLIYQHKLNGSAMVHEAVAKIFTCVNKVFVNQMCSWMLYGDLKDPYNEFFITRTPKRDHSDSVLSARSTTNVAEKSLVSTLQLQESMGECACALRPAMIPYFMPLSLAQEILFIGNTIILFGLDPQNEKRGRSLVSTRSMLPLQKCKINSRRFTIWEEKEAEFHEKLQRLKQPAEFEVCYLRVLVKEIRECVTKHVWSVAVEEGQLVQELRLVKDFFLLGRGELFLELLRLAAHVLDKPTTRTSTRDMNHAFQTAARAVLLHDSADLDKFSFELPYSRTAPPAPPAPSDASADSARDDDASLAAAADGWSSVVLKYELKWPLHLLFAPEVLARYNDMFRLLLRIKKTQHDLHALWKTYKQSTCGPLCQLHNKLMFLMDNLQQYMQADVLDTNFSRLMLVARHTNDFARLKKAHAAFLADVLSQSFLTVTKASESECPRTGNTDTDGDGSLNNPVFCNVMELLKLCDSFCGISELLTDADTEHYYITGYTDRFNKLVKQLLELLVSLRDRPCGVHLSRLLVRLDYNRWLSGEARLTHSVTNMLQ